MRPSLWPRPVANLFSPRRYARLPCPSHENANAMLFTCPSSHGMKTRTRFVFLYCCSSAFGNPQLTTRTQPPSPFLFAMAGGTTRRRWRRFGAQHDDGGSGLEGGTLVSSAAATLWLRREKNTCGVCAFVSTPVSSSHDASQHFPQRPPFLRHHNLLQASP